MLALNREAQWLMIQVSGNLERRLRQIATQVALHGDSSEISLEHMKVAVQQITGDNTALLKCLLDEVGVTYGERQAG